MVDVVWGEDTYVLLSRCIVINEHTNMLGKSRYSTCIALLAEYPFGTCYRWQHLVAGGSFLFPCPDRGKREALTEGQVVTPGLQVTVVLNPLPLYTFRVNALLDIQYLAHPFGSSKLVWSLPLCPA